MYAYAENATTIIDWLTLMCWAISLSVISVPQWYIRMLAHSSLWFTLVSGIFLQLMVWFSCDLSLHYYPGYVWPLKLVLSIWNIVGGQNCKSIFVGKWEPHICRLKGKHTASTFYTGIISQFSIYVLMKQGLELQVSTSNTPHTYHLANWGT